MRLNAWPAHSSTMRPLEAWDIRTAEQNALRFWMRSAIAERCPKGAIHETCSCVCICVIWSVLAQGCATTPSVPLGREKPGATMQEYMADRYACLLESSSRVSGAAVNVYGGASSSAVSCNYQLYDACMNARSYYVVQNGRFQAPVVCAR